MGTPTMVSPMVSLPRVSPCTMSRSPCCKRRILPGYIESSTCDSPHGRGTLLIRSRFEERASPYSRAYSVPGELRFAIFPGTGEERSYAGYRQAAHSAAGETLVKASLLLVEEANAVH